MPDPRRPIEVDRVDVLAANIEQQSRELAGVKSQLVQIDQMMSEAHVVLARLLAADTDDDTDRDIRRGTPTWNCGRCNTVLGKFGSGDRKGELSMRIKHVAVFFVAGAGGSLLITCPRCTQTNRICSDGEVPPKDLVAGQAYEAK